MILFIAKWLLFYVLEHKHNFYVEHFLSLTVQHSKKTFTVSCIRNGSVVKEYQMGCFGQTEAIDWSFSRVWCTVQTVTVRCSRGGEGKGVMVLQLLQRGVSWKLQCCTFLWRQRSDFDRMLIPIEAQHLASIGKRAKRVPLGYLLWNSLGSIGCT